MFVKHAMVTLTDPTWDRSKKTREFGYLSRSSSPLLYDEGKAGFNVKIWLIYRSESGTNRATTEVKWQ